MLHVHRAERADGLVRALAALLSDPLADPFSPEVVCVPTRGMERWLTQRLSTVLGATSGRSDGVCANVEFPSPRRLAEDAVGAAAGIDPDADVWRPERMVWPLLEVVDASLGEPWLSTLAAHLAGDRRARRFAAVRHVAELFDRYALQRPAMIRAWAAGRDTDAVGAALPPDAAWQAELWRRLRTRVAQPDPAERVAAACARLRADPDVLDLPARLSLFGLTRLPTGRLYVLEALAAHHDVHLFLLHPSPGLWERIRGTPAVTRRADDPTRALPANPILASWGHDARELQLVVQRGADEDRLHTTAPRDGTLLAGIQADVRADRPPPGAPLPGRPDERLELDRDDRSVQVHACHGRARQVEVLRDAILHALAADPTLEPRDVIVMCPDVESFAPLIHATLGAAEEAGDAPDLRVRLADRSLRQTNPVLGVVARVLELADERLTASQVLDLADREPVRRRFQLDDDDLARIEEWVAASGIRWGLDGAHRAPFKLDRLDAGTWRAGLDRLLLGVAMTEDEPRLYHGVLPLDDVESGAIDLAGRLAELVDRLHAAVDAMREPIPVDAWAQVIADAADALAATSERDAWQRAELQRILDGVVAEAAATGARTPLEATEARALLADRLQGRPTRTSFRTGHLTVCTLVPMRSVPHRVVCLLGLDDGEFPRKVPRDGDDLVLRDPHVGDREPRTEDRQMLLDALMAATDRLIVTYTGRDERTNNPRPPSVPVGELLDVVDASAHADAGPARERVLVQHPLQPFDPRNFTPGELAPGTPWGFDAVTLAGARAIESPRVEPGPFLREPLPGTEDAVVELEDLVRFAEHPVRAFLRQRLGVSLGDAADETADALTVELDALEQWRVGDRLLAARLAGARMDDCISSELARGLLPPGELGAPVLATLRPKVEAIVGHALSLARGEPRSADVRVTLPGGRVLSGSVAGVYGDLLRSVTFARVSARQRIALWVRWLALAAADPERPAEAALVGRASGGASTATRIVRLRPLAGDPARRRERALALLDVLVDLRRRGLREPLPIACRSSAAWVSAGAAAAHREWESEWGREREDRDAEHQLVFGGVLPFEDLLARAPRDDERGDGWDERETTRFGRLARRLWSAPLAVQEVADR